ncbi:hypothetical protein OPT61_g3034 [Boeremia exigua]|uniref:Uncharacterized protein n=1 Tax=Boeremia exigua TaxID=749465 RepID=A0ACC2IJL9_9PLEO|nr:hypothetical protein OPT61_g3034 [Boeremia exigua]
MRLFRVAPLTIVRLVAALRNNFTSVIEPQRLTTGALQAGTGPDDEFILVDFPATIIDDAGWSNLLCKGENLVKAMHGSNKDAGALFKPPTDSAESKWTSMEDLKTWHWQEKRIDPEEENESEYWSELGFDHVLKDLGLPNLSNDDPTKGIKTIFVSHDGYSLSTPDETYKVGDKTYRTTGAFYKFGIETTTGTIFGLDRYSPEAASVNAEPPIQKDGLPELMRFSDIAWLFWDQLQTKEKHHIQHFFCATILNEETQRAIRRALEKTNQEFSVWPGALFKTDTDEGKVLLGSPNGRAFGYFLAQHKAEIGRNLYISEIRVFMGDQSEYSPNMCRAIGSGQEVTREAEGVGGSEGEVVTKPEDTRLRGEAETDTARRLQEDRHTLWQTYRS